MTYSNDSSLSLSLYCPTCTYHKASWLLFDAVFSIIVVACVFMLIHAYIACLHSDNLSFTWNDTHDTHGTTLP